MLRSLLQRVPQADRTEAIRAAIDSIGSDGTADIGLTVLLLSELPDDETKQALRARLLRLLEGGQTELVRAVCAQDAVLQCGLLRQVAQRLDGFVGEVEQQSPTDQAVPIENVMPLRESTPSL